MGACLLGPAVADEVYQDIISGARSHERLGPRLRTISRLIAAVLSACCTTPVLAASPPSEVVRFRSGGFGESLSTNAPVSHAAGVTIRAEDEQMMPGNGAESGLSDFSIGETELPGKDTGEAERVTSAGPPDVLLPESGLTREPRLAGSALYSTLALTQALPPSVEASSDTGSTRPVAARTDVGDEPAGIGMANGVMPTPPRTEAAAPTWTAASLPLRSFQTTALDEVRTLMEEVVYVYSRAPPTGDIRPTDVGLNAILTGQPRDRVMPIIALVESLTAPVDANPTPGPPVAIAEQIGLLQSRYEPLQMSIGLPITRPVCENPSLGTPSSILLSCASIPSGKWAVSFQQGDVTGKLTTDTWLVDAHPDGGIHLRAASGLSTPLDAFSDAPPWGVAARAPWGSEVFITPLGVGVLQHMPIWHGDFLVGLTPLGPVAGIELPPGPFRVQATALLSDGEVLATGALTLQVRDLTISYTFSPSDNGIAARFAVDPLDLTISLDSSGLQVGWMYDLGNGQIVKGSWDGSGLQVGWVYDMRNGQIVKASWSFAEGFQVAFVASLELW